MYINDYLDKKGYNYNLKLYRFEGKEYRYTEAIYDYNNERFAKYFILDMINDEEYMFFEQEWNDADRFRAFETGLLEDAFFQSEGDTRFNLYMVFLVPESSSILTNNEILNDFRYARKIALAGDRIRDYFDSMIPLERGAMTNKEVDLKGLREGVDIINKELQEAKALLLKETMVHLQLAGGKDFEAERIVQLLALIDQRTLPEYSYLPGFQIPLKRKKIDQIQSIEELVLKDYRCFSGIHDIPFKQVNLLYGENGVGKTSILEAIELAFTGVNRNKEEKGISDEIAKVTCIGKGGNRIELSSNKDNTKRSEQWYRVRTKEKKEFNDLFNRYNYFDTKWASAFAIEGRETVNQNQIEKFLGINAIESGFSLLERLFEDIRQLAKCNIEKAQKQGKSTSLRSLQHTSGDIYQQSKYKLIEEASRETIDICTKQIQELVRRENGDSYTDILQHHIERIEQIFKFLVSAGEYASLQLDKDELVAITRGTSEKIAMSDMSTGQKVCLALAFMFALFLSSDSAPNIIMLDEPVANLDDAHMLNLFDLLRRLVLGGTQIFFTTANPDVAKLFRRKFSFLKEDFGLYDIKENDQSVDIIMKQYSQTCEKPQIKTIQKLEMNAENMMQNC